MHYGAMVAFIYSKIAWNNHDVLSIYKIKLKKIQHTHKKKKFQKYIPG